MKYVPQTYDTYVEPFLGGGAVFLSLQPEKSLLADVNTELINSYNVVKDDLEGLVKLLKVHVRKNSQEYFYEVRAWDREINFSEKYSPAERAARFIYLNKTCFNGLYRQNKQGYFNSPWGYYESPKILDEISLKDLSLFFRENKTIFRDGSFETILEEVGVNDFVYLDPPYVPLNDTSFFVQYSKQGFNADAHKSLAEEAARLDNLGAYVLASNSDTPLVRELYKGFIFKPIQVTRSIGADKLSRKKVDEVLILGKNLVEVLKL